jgi:carotenoid cleavage dioxygenase-like enzyme
LVLPSQVDAAEGVLYNFGLAAPPATAISLFALDSNGQVLRTGSFALPAGQQQLVHDCAMSGEFLCFMVDPWSISSTQSWLQVTTLGNPNPGR